MAEIFKLLNMVEVAAQDPCKIYSIKVIQKCHFLSNFIVLSNLKEEIVVSSNFHQHIVSFVKL